MSNYFYNYRCQITITITITENGVMITITNYHYPNTDIHPIMCEHGIDINCLIVIQLLEEGGMLHVWGD